MRIFAPTLQIPIPASPPSLQAHWKHQRDEGLSAGRSLVRSAGSEGALPGDRRRRHQLHPDPRTARRPRRAVRGLRRHPGIDPGSAGEAGSRQAAADAVLPLCRPIAAGRSRSFLCTALGGCHPARGADRARGDGRRIPSTPAQPRTPGAGPECPGPAHRAAPRSRHE